MAVERAPRVRIVLIAPPTSNAFTGGYLFNARVLANAPAGSCEAREQTPEQLRRDLAADPAGDEILVLDSLFLPLIEPSVYRDRRVIQLVHSLPITDAPRVDAALGRSAGCITTSEFMAATVQQRASTAQVRVCWPGVTATPRLTAEPRPEPIVLTVANFEHRKGHMELLQALQRLRDVPWHWQVIGDLDADQECSRAFVAAVAESGLAERITVLGRQSPEQVQHAMATADVFALLSAREPFGMVYRESVASGTPVVAWREGGVLESVTHDITGLLAPPHDVAAAAECLRALLTSAPLRARMRRACVAAAGAFADWNECAAGFVVACRDLAEAAP